MIEIPHTDVHTYATKPLTIQAVAAGPSICVQQQLAYEIIVHHQWIIGLNKITDRWCLLHNDIDIDITFNTREYINIIVTLIIITIIPVKITTSAKIAGTNGPISRGPDLKDRYDADTDNGKGAVGLI